MDEAARLQAFVVECCNNDVDLLFDDLVQML